MGICFRLLVCGLVSTICFAALTQAQEVPEKQETGQALKQDEKKQNEDKQEQNKNDDTKKPKAELKQDDEKADGKDKADATQDDKKADRKQDDKKADDKKADDKKADDKKADDRKADDRKADDRKADDRKADDKKADAKQEQEKADNKIVVKETEATQENSETNKPANAKIVVKQPLSSAHFLPPNTKLWLSIPDATQLVNDLNDTQFGELAGNDNLQPFVEKLSKQMTDYLDKNNVDLGIKTDDLGEVHTGEICMAAVKNDGAEVSDYGFIMMIDVTETELEAKELLARIGGELEKQKATQKEVEIAGQKAIKWSYPKAEGLVKQRFVYHVLIDRWLIVCDNEKLTTDALGRINQAEGVVGSLAESEVFKKVRSECAFGDGAKDPQIKLFVEPFGYFDILQKISDQKKKVGERGNDYPKILRQTGFDAIKGFGGNIVVNNKHQIVYRSYLHAPANADEPGRKYKGAAEMLRLENEKGHDLLPESFVPDKSSGYFSVSWNMVKAFDNVKPIMDALLGENSFDSVVKEIKEEPTGPRVDLRAMVKKLDDRITIFTDNTTPINESSEKVVVAVKVKDDVAVVFDMLQRIINPPAAKVIDFEGVKLIIDEEVEDDIEIDILEIDGGEDTVEEDDEPESPKPLFEKRIYSTVGSYILMSNDLDYMKKLIQNAKNNPGNKFRNATDFVDVNKELAKHIDPNRVSLRQFIRLDESVRVNYEMLRQGKMGSSNTVLAKLLNQVLMPKDSDDTDIREQKIDGKDLPANFDKEIAPYLGAAGFVLETEKDGWILSGVVLPKKKRSNVASKGKDGSQRE